jgi:hypothetical protein
MSLIDMLTMLAMAVGGAVTAWAGFCRARIMHGPHEPWLRRWANAVQGGAGLALLLVAVAPWLPPSARQSATDLADWGLHWAAVYVVASAVLQIGSPRWRLRVARARRALRR